MINTPLVGRGGGASHAHVVDFKTVQAIVTKFRVPSQHQFRILCAKITFLVIAISVTPLPTIVGPKMANV